MATVKVPLEVVEDHIAQHGAIKVTNFSWSNEGYNSTPEIEWELDGIEDLEYEDDDYVEIEDYNRLESERNELQREVEELTMKVDDLEMTLSAITAQLQHEQEKKFW